MRLLQPRLYHECAGPFPRKPDPNEEEIKEYLAGNLCRCSGYEGQLRGIQNFLAWKNQRRLPNETVNQPVRKKDAMQLVTGQPVYMDDVIPQDCLIVKLLRSPTPMRSSKY